MHYINKKSVSSYYPQISAYLVNPLIRYFEGTSRYFTPMNKKSNFINTKSISRFLLDYKSLKNVWWDHMYHITGSEKASENNLRKFLNPRSTVEIITIKSVKFVNMKHLMIALSERGDLNRLSIKTIVAKKVMDGDLIPVNDLCSSKIDASMVTFLVHHLEISNCSVDTDMFVNKKSFKETMDELSIVNYDNLSTKSKAFWKNKEGKGVEIFPSLSLMIVSGKAVDEINNTGKIIVETAKQEENSWDKLFT